MNWGGFAGGLAQGVQGGVSMIRNLDGIIKERKVSEMRAQGMAEAQAAREAAINDSIKGGAPAAVNGLTGQPAEVPAAAPAETQTTPSNPAGLDRPSATAAPVAQSSAQPPTGSGAKAVASEAPAPITPQSAPAQGLPFSVNGKGYATREEARAAAEKSTPGVMDFVGKPFIDRMQQVYLEQGNVEMADAWGKWAEDKQNKAAMKEWSSAFRAAQFGNFEKAADHVFNLYKQYDDGITPLSKETVKDKDGNITGFNVKLKNDKSGEEYSQFIDKKALTELGLSALSPPQMFEQQFKRQQQADQAAAELAKENRAFQRDIAKGDRKFEQEKQMEGIKAGNAIEKMTIEKQLDAANASTKVKREVGAKVQALKDAGYTDEFINGVLPGIIGVGEYKKATSPEEARRLAHSDRMKSDPMYGRKSADEQQKILDQDMKLIYGGVKPSSTQSPAAAGGLPQPGSTQQKKGVPFYDTKTNSIVYR